MAGSCAMGGSGRVTAQLFCSAERPPNIITAGCFASAVHAVITTGCLAEQRQQQLVPGGAGSSFLQARAAAQPHRVG